MAKERATDILIGGGGHVGLALAAALRQADARLGVVVVDAAEPGAEAKDTRASAIAAAGRRLLQGLDAWDEIARTAEPIREMVITDSRTRDVARPVFLTFAEPEEAGEPFAHMVWNGQMIAALRRRAEAAGATILAPETITGFAVNGAGVTAKLGSGGTVTARLLVAADGVKSALRDMAGIGTVGTSYGQSGIVVTVAHEKPHQGRAVEHFLPAGPFAILPLPGNRSSLVWTEADEDAAKLVEGDPLLFKVELERRFGHELGAIEAVDAPRAFPLRLVLARSFVKPRFALAGDAAHGIHPIAGQGLNLGFRDVAALAETIVEADRLGLDIGSLAVLSRYERWRRFDTVETGMMMDILNRLFSNDLAPVRLLRDVGLGLVDRMPGLKRFFMREAAGATGELPRLLKGEAI
jgi:2-octaprenyl-6-methoxyphenol hydroxylase